MRFRLRTLLIVLAIGPPVLGWYGWPALQTWLAKKPLPPPVSTAAPTSNGTPYLAAYATGKLDPVMTENTLQTLLARASNTRIQLDTNTGQLTVWAPNYVHKMVQKIIGQLQQSGTKIIKNTIDTPARRPVSEAELEAIKQRAAELGAPQPKPLPPGYGETPNQQ